MSCKATIITGANGVIGFRLAQRLHQAGHKLLLFYHNQNQRVQQLPCPAYKCDLQAEHAFTKVLTKALQEHNCTPAAVVHCAALRASDHTALAESDPTTWKTVLEFNVYSAYHVLHAVLPLMQQQGQGRVVLFGSDINRRGLAYGSAYAAAKAALSGLVKSVATELGPKQVLVNLVSPGPIEMGKTSFSGDYQEFRDKYYKAELAQTPLARHANADDICGLVEFLIGNTNTFITGEEIFISGGRL